MDRPPRFGPLLRHCCAPKSREAVADALGAVGWAVVPCAAAPEIEGTAVRASVVLVARIRSRVDDIGCRVSGVVRGAAISHGSSEERSRRCGQAHKTIARAAGGAARPGAGSA